MSLQEVAIISPSGEVTEKHKAADVDFGQRLLRSLSREGRDDVERMIRVSYPGLMMDDQSREISTDPKFQIIPTMSSLFLSLRDSQVFPQVDGAHPLIRTLKVEFNLDCTLSSTMGNLPIVKKLSEIVDLKSLPTNNHMINLFRVDVIKFSCNYLHSLDVRIGSSIHNVWWPCPVRRTKIPRPFVSRPGLCYSRHEEYPRAKIENNPMWALYVADCNLDGLVQELPRSGLDRRDKDKDYVLLKRCLETTILISTLREGVIEPSLAFEIDWMLSSGDDKYYKIPRMAARDILTLAKYICHNVKIHDLEIMVSKFDGSSWMDDPALHTNMNVSGLMELCYRIFPEL
jgi:hypothetical protein